MGRVARLLPLTCAVVLSGCHSDGPVAAPTSALRSSARGVCAEAVIEGVSKQYLVGGRRLHRIDTCLKTGQPGVFTDDGQTPTLVTTVYGVAGSPDSDVSNWQLEAFRNGVAMGKLALARSRSSPQVNLRCDLHDCEDWSMNSLTWQSPWSPGTYVFRYTLDFDTSQVAINTITVQP